MQRIEMIRQLFAERGDSNYGGEAVTQRQHALQCAALAESAGDPPSLIVAALLHDVGHLLHDLSEDAPEHGVDDRHEHLAAEWLQAHFEQDVAAPAALHVEAKRYLCATDASYHASLSEPSQLSLQLQGGPMSDDEVRAFQALPYAEEAAKLRRYDDGAKVVDLPTPNVEHFLAIAAGLPLPSEQELPPEQDLPSE